MEISKKNSSEYFGKTVSVLSENFMKISDKLH